MAKSACANRVLVFHVLHHLYLIKIAKEFKVPNDDQMISFHYQNADGAFDWDIYDIIIRTSGQNPRRGEEPVSSMFIGGNHS